MDGPETSSSRARYLTTLALPPAETIFRHPMHVFRTSLDQVAALLSPRLHPPPPGRRFVDSPVDLVAELAGISRDVAAALVAEAPTDRLVQEMIEGVSRGIPRELARAQAPPPTRAWQAMLAGIYGLIRALRPEKVVETGVGLMGASSTFVLQALDRNSFGNLWSVDLDRYATLFGVHVGQGIPPRLKTRHNLVVGDVRRELEGTLAAAPAPTVFIHDSLHTYSNMISEYDLAWKYLTQGGILLSDDATNSAFDDFSHSVGAQAAFCDCGSIYAGTMKGRRVVR